MTKHSGRSVCDPATAFAGHVAPDYSGDPANRTTWGCNGDSLRDEDFAERSGSSNLNVRGRQTEDESRHESCHTKNGRRWYWTWGKLVARTRVALRGQVRSTAIYLACAVLGGTVWFFYFDNSWNDWVDESRSEKRVKIVTIFALFMVIVNVSRVLLAIANFSPKLGK